MHRHPATRLACLAALTGLALAAPVVSQDIRDRTTLRANQGLIVAIDFSPDGKLLAWGASAYTPMFDGMRPQPGMKAGNEIKIHDATNGQVRHTFAGHTDTVNGVAFSHDGRLIASASEDKTIKIYDLDSGKEIATLKGHTGAVNSVAFLPGDKALVSGSYDRTVRVWDLDGAKEKATIYKGKDTVWRVAVSPDGKTVAAATWGEVPLLDPATGKQTGRLKGHEDWVFGVTFSADGQKVATASADKTVRLWDVANGKGGVVLKGHGLPVFSVSFSPDGKLLASGAGEFSKPGEAKVWDLTTGQEKQSLGAHRDRVNSVAFSRDGTSLATASFDRTVVIYSVNNAK